MHFGNSDCKDLLPAPGNRSNETHDIERRTCQREGREDRNEGEKESGGEKRWSEKEDTAGRCILTCRNCGGGDRGRVAIYRPFGEVSLSLNRSVTCMVLKANDRRTSCPCHDEFRGPRSDYVRQWLDRPGWAFSRSLFLASLLPDVFSNS
ncbi:uncharacterized protein TNCV_4443751 [Trichonephila clavipes]|nr:uncharacterized protein TNCV_4443751 [Trichonephila clavipes]